MATLREWMNRFWGTIRGHRMDRDLEEELRTHLELATEDHRRRTGSPARAARAAAVEQGGLAQAMESMRDQRGLPWLDDAKRDVRYAVRGLARNPGFTVVAVLMLALGIGLTTAIFSVVYGVLFRPLPFTEPDRLVALHTIRETDVQADTRLSPPNFMSLQEDLSPAFESLTGFAVTDHTLTGIADARRIASARVGAQFFEVLDVRPVLGRTFRPEENLPGQDRVVVLGHDLWQQLGGDRDVLGRAIVLDSISYTVIGVMAPGFDFPGGRALWYPQPYGRNYFSAASAEGRRNNGLVRVVGRLRPAISLSVARAELSVRGSALEGRFPSTNTGVRFTATPLHEDLVGDTRTPLLLLFGAVGLVLVIATTNVAGLLLARAASRRAEIALRGALGAGHGRIIRQLVTESVVLGLGSGALGLVLATWATRMVVGTQLEDLRGLGLVDAIRVDGPVLTFAVGVTLVAGVVASLLPAFRAADEGLAATLRSAGRTPAMPYNRRLRNALIVGQLALAVVLLDGAGLLLRSFVRLTSVDPGFRTEGVLSFELSLPLARYGADGRAQALVGDLLERIRQHPGVLSAGAIHHLPIGSAGSFRSRFQVEGVAPRAEQDVIGVRVVSPDYFRSVDVPVLKGRGLTDQDRPGGHAVILINEAAAAQFFPGQDPIGRQLINFSYDPIEDTADAFTVVGVVANVRSRGLREAPQAEAYFAHAQVSLPSMFLVVRTSGTPLAHTGAIRAEIRALDPNLPVPAFRTLDQVLADSVERPRSFVTLVSLFSVAALTLSAVGIFGLLSFSVARKTHEIGLRMALGASAGAVVAAIVREAFMLVAVGLGIGLAGALALTRLLRSELFEIRSTDPVTMTGVILVLAATALLASLVPAWRAAAVDPLIALRSE